MYYPTFRNYTNTANSALNTMKTKYINFYADSIYMYY